MLNTRSDQNEQACRCDDADLCRRSFANDKASDLLHAMIAAEYPAICTGTAILQAAGAKSSRAAAEVRLSCRPLLLPFSCLVL